MKTIVAGFMFFVFGMIILAGAPVPRAEEVDETWEQAWEDDADPSEFEGESEDMPGERAPEYLPMDDAPAMGGIALE